MMSEKGHKRKFAEKILNDDDLSISKITIREALKERNKRKVSEEDERDGVLAPI